MLKLREDMEVSEYDEKLIRDLFNQHTTSFLLGCRRMLDDDSLATDNHLDMMNILMLLHIDIEDNKKITLGKEQLEDIYKVSYNVSYLVLKYFEWYTLKL